MTKRNWDKKVYTVSANVMILGTALGIIARFLMMVWGNNYDFESYKIVGEIVSKGGNVYAETSRYNYAFIFSLIQGIGYRVFGSYEQLFRVYIVGVLTLVDVGIMLWMSDRYNNVYGLLFFLNPISIVITGYHNQFDNIAVLFALIASSFYDEESEKLTKKDLISIVFLTLSMLTKHLLFMFFIWILFRKMKGRIKKIVYVFVPGVIFILSFIPFVVCNEKAFDGVLNNVFLYRSYNNYPLLRYLLRVVAIPNQLYFVIYLVMMAVIGWAFRKRSFRDQLLLYFVCMVSFSSAVANQYLIIPIAALIICENKLFFIAYELLGTMYCVLNVNELHLDAAITSRIPGLSNIISKLSGEGGIMITMMMIVLAFAIVRELVVSKAVLNRHFDKE